ncbi:MAG: hypothetical protein E7774_14850 [Bradyrhizobium sp.]|nr:MAG: hypothetical protein E7774_14850 [Bradyrhizobium sp.]
MTQQKTTKAKAPSAQPVAVDLTAVLVAVADGRPLVMTIEDGWALPSGPFAVEHRSLQAGLRGWVERQTGHPLGYVEQLYTFADSDRRQGVEGAQAISISYLGLLQAQPSIVPLTGWRPWYDYFPWEDHRGGAPQLIAKTIAPELRRWAKSGETGARWNRAAIAFGLEGRGWNEELVLQRYELLYEAQLIAEAQQASRKGAAELGRPMIGDHRRILATGIARVRAKIKYNPVVFELMAPVFTMLQLQRCVEAIAGLDVHKPNFRRLIEQQQLVEETGESVTDTGGRPARAFRFRAAVREERAAAGTKLPLARS